MCPFTKGFSTPKKININNEVNTRFVYAMRIIGRGFSAGKRLCATMNIPSFMSKNTFIIQERSILLSSTHVAKESMKVAGSAVHCISKSVSRKISECGVWYLATSRLLLSKRCTKCHFSRHWQSS